MMTRILKTIDFGKVDSESETNLEKKFIKTSNFTEAVSMQNMVIVGAKGSGKSAIFELLTKHESDARVLAGGALSDTIIIAGTGLFDLGVLSGDDLEQLLKEDEIDFKKIWYLYISIKLAIRLAQEGFESNGVLRSFLKATRQIRDYRILPLLQEAWRAMIGPRPTKITIKNPAVGEVSIEIGKEQFDTSELLSDINSMLAANRKKVLILFDKIDEIFPSDSEKRNRAIEGLFQACLGLSRTYPCIHLKILIRTDIWNKINFVNKSHLVDKMTKIVWDQRQIVSLFCKRAVQSETLVEFLVPRLGFERSQMRSIDNNPSDVNLKIFYAIFASQIYPGIREAVTLDWIIERLKDGTDNFFPREFITLGNMAVDAQIKKNESIGVSPGDGGALIEGRTILDAFLEVSMIRRNTYLSEFPHLSRHFDRFKDQTTAEYSRDALNDLMVGLDPDGDDLIKELVEIVGLLRPLGASVTTRRYEIPRLYRTGLGLAIPGRP